MVFSHINHADTPFLDLKAIVAQLYGKGKQIDFSELPNKLGQVFEVIFFVIFFIEKDEKNSQKTPVIFSMVLTMIHHYLDTFLQNS